MVREDSVSMSIKELRRVHVMQQVIERKLTQVAAREILDLTDRQIRRLVGRVRTEGERGLIHRSRGKPSNRGIAPSVKAKALRLYAQQYGDFGPTLAAEKLGERDGLAVSEETLRGWLLAAGVTHFRRRKRPHRQWRERKAHVGELVQLDGSQHPWFEDRGPACVLMSYIDDATGRVFARFYPYEGTVPALDSFRQYVRHSGLPQALYTDKHATYKSPAEPTIEEQLAGQAPQSQFERALAELGVDLIHAHSPQAKGRVERLFKTLQDRLVKELRLAGISTLDAANAFLAHWLPLYNRRFAVAPRGTANLHRPRPTARELDRILCQKTVRRLRNDFTVAHNGALYQIDDQIRAARVTVAEHLKGRLRIWHHDRALAFHRIGARPQPVELAAPMRRPRRIGKPAPDHPWRTPRRPHQPLPIQHHTQQPDISTLVGTGHF